MGRTYGVGVAWMAIGAALAAPGLGQAAEEATGTDWTAVKVPCVGVVTASRLQVRSGPSTNHYATGFLERGQSVVVEQVAPGNWLGIRPPKGSFSYISAQFVTVKGSVGTVTGDRVRVRIGSELSDKLEEVQLQLSRGDTVKVIGSKTFKVAENKEEKWLKIEPPPGEWRWVSGQFVDPVRPLAGSKDDGTILSPASQEADATALKCFNEAEAQYRAMRDKPIRDWDFTEVRRLYAEAAAKASKQDLRAIVSRRLQQIEADEKHRAKYDAFARLEAETDAKLQQLAGKGAPATRPSAAGTQPLAPGQAQAVGILREAAVPLGDQQEIRHKLTPGADSAQVTVYLQAGQVDLAPYVGKRVRVIGRFEKRDSWGADLIIVDQVQVLDR